MKKVQKNSLTTLLAVLIIFIMYNYFQQETGQYIVKTVIDGDTIELNDGEKVRYIGIDAPEFQSSKKNAEKFAEEAFQANRKIVENRKVKLEFDVEQRDQYGRLLAYVYTEDGIMVNEWLVANGYAKTVVFPPNVRYVDRFKNLEKEAQKQKIGLWDE
ncbi:thermonuclease family protein [Atribacter laminatus]|uniref:SPBc2 prophage-derived endonuclease YokF n=1 Tax=Atribacter laminatus TaxID=2847778 RepID=A0A7T1AJL8_ATRLM|nr:thermonuclease family protein [Atribacter laminatus]QPM67115.1 SPBc2 prophage-derived endonuclease YokF [Atribacter laminatus]